MAANNSAVTIGVFDSGVGGLSVLRAIRKQLPAQPVIYIGDQFHVPYGQRSLEEVRQLTYAAIRFLLDQGAKLIVIACNTASAAALHYVREQLPDVPIVGMEPAVKPAAEQTKTGVVGVLATYAFFQAAVYNSLVERFAHGVKLLQDPCIGLVGQIEKGDLDGPDTRSLLEEVLKPMLAQHIDTVVLGCTHYPFVIPLIQQIVGPDVRVIDPAPAVARHIAHRLEEFGWLAKGDQKAPVIFYTSGEPQQMQKLLLPFIGEEGIVLKATWIGDRLSAS